MGHDLDHHEGQRVSRRSVIAGIGSLSLGGLLAACGVDAASPGASSTPSSTASPTPTGAAPTGATAPDLAELFKAANVCTLTPNATQGPYYFDADEVRSDIREDRAGTQLRLAIKVQDSESCAALANAVVEIWHCDAGGLYSGAESSATGGAPGGGPPGGGVPGGSPGGPAGGGGADADLVPTDDKRYLRGAQVTNADGVVEFTTIWPGWYRGRTVHVHAMVHFSNQRVLTTQIMFDEALNAKVFTAAPYASHTGRDTFNNTDTIYRAGMLMRVVESGGGYLGAIVFAADSDRDGS